MIRVENLTKSFGPKKAVDDVSFEVIKGEVLGFLGPNGAGKSTTMRMITGFIPTTSGSVTVGGFDMLENPIPAKKLAAAAKKPGKVGKRARLAETLRGMK